MGMNLCHHLNNIEQYSVHEEEDGQLPYLDALTVKMTGKTETLMVNNLNSNLHHLTTINNQQLSDSQHGTKEWIHLKIINSNTNKWINMVTRVQPKQPH